MELKRLTAGLLAAVLLAATAVTTLAEGAEDWELAQLDTTGQEIYESYVDQLSELETTLVAPFSGSDQEAFDAFKDVIWLLKKQNPAIFWLSYEAQSCTIKGGSGELTYSPEFSGAFTGGGTLDADAVQNAQKQIAATVAEIGAGATTRETVSRFNDWLCGNVNYTFNYSNDRTYEITGSLIDRAAACEGYAKAFKYLCDQAGIGCVVVSGAGRNWGRTYSHAWNYVQMDDGAWYLVDPTWNNLSGRETWFLLGSKSTAGGSSLLNSHAPDGHSYPALAEDDYGA